MTFSRRAAPAGLLAGLLVIGLGLQGCVATTVAGATLHVAAATVVTTAKVGGKVAGATAHVTTHAVAHALKRPSKPPPATS